ncbi:MAG: glycosyltransferase family 2 protein [Actinomycetota bacterium]|nr:glycosyltransferase family 2 protein [Actinomycetota bacterium]
MEKEISITDKKENSRIKNSDMESNKELSDAFENQINSPKVLLIIINYNGINHIGECLDSIYSQTYGEFEVLVVDNNSKDGSVDFIRKKYPQCELLVNWSNKGYGDAFNKAVKYGLKKYKKVDYFGILNNDLRLDRQWLENLVSYGEQKPDCGILAGKMLIYYWPKYINSTGGFVNYFGSGWDRDFFELDEECHTKSGEVLSVSGGAALIKKGVFDSIGFFESRYFMYYEDIDFCFRTWKYSDYSVDYVKEALVYHKFSATSGVLSLKKHFYLKRSRFIFILKNYPIGFLAKTIPQITKYEFGFIMKDLIVRYDFMNFFREFYIYLIFLTKLPLIIGKRIATKDYKSSLKIQKAMKMWAMVSTTTTNSGRKYIPMEYLDILWNKFEKYGEKTNRIIMGINDKGLGRGWKSLIAKGYPRGRFFFNYADLVLENPYRGESYKYYFQLQYFLYHKKEESLYVNIEGSIFKLKLKERMNTAVFEVPNELLKDQKEITVIFSFNKDMFKKKKDAVYNDAAYLNGDTEKMGSDTFKEFVRNFKDLFVIEVAVLSEDSQYLRNEMAGF